MTGLRTFLDLGLLADAFKSEDKELSSFATFLALTLFSPLPGFFLDDNGVVGKGFCK